MPAEGSSPGAPACAVARLDPDGAWIGFAPTLEDGYALVVGSASTTSRRAAAPEELVALAMVYFEDGLPEPPEELAATLGDIGAVVRHVAEAGITPAQGRAYQDAVDAIDDGLPTDAVLQRLARILGALVGDAEPEELLRRRAAALHPLGDLEAGPA